MIDNTQANSDILDQQRDLLLGSARLFLLNHDDDEGYESETEITSGWMIADDSEGEGASDGQLKLEVCESTVATAARLNSVIAIAYFEEGEEEASVMKIESRRKPMDRTLRLWQFDVTPSGETFTL